MVTSAAVSTNPLQQLNAEALYAALRLLAADEESRPARDEAARILLSQLRLLAGRALSARFSWANWLRRSRDLGETLEDAIQHVAVAASTGSSRFRGRHPSEAVAWCQRVLSNFLTSESRRRARNLTLLAGERDAAIRLESHLEGVVWHHADQEAALLLLKLEARVWKHLTQTRTREASESLYRAVCRYLGYLAGHPEQISGRCELSEESHPAESCSEETHPGATPCARAARRARDRRYQHHRRARRILAELLENDALQPEPQTVICQLPPDPWRRP